MSGRFVRLAEQNRRPVRIFVDGAPVEALEEDTLLTAMLTATSHVRVSEFGGGRRAGFCLMGACQDCWVWTAAGERLRACTTRVAEGMSVSTRGPAEDWSDAQVLTDIPPSATGPVT